MWSAYEPLIKTWPSNDKTLLETLIKFAPNKASIKKTYELFNDKAFEELKNSITPFQAKNLVNSLIKRKG